ncbi:hypothetical protein BX600DRAFT_431812 [Xylariales sp. PMI_506]|nr:hypothetical protein BX600DRAFT_431812 [Xylariales sp. PMI_506]
MGSYCCFGGQSPSHRRPRRHSLIIQIPALQSTTERRRPPTPFPEATLRKSSTLPIPSYSPHVLGTAYIRERTFYHPPVNSVRYVRADTSFKRQSKHHDRLARSDVKCRNTAHRQYVDKWCSQNRELNVRSIENDLKRNLLIARQNKEIEARPRLRHQRPASKRVRFSPIVTISKGTNENREEMEELLAYRLRRMNITQ